MFINPTNIQCLPGTAFIPDGVIKTSVFLLYRKYFFNALPLVCFSVVCEIGPFPSPPSDVPNDPSFVGLVEVEVEGGRRGQSTVKFTYRVTICILRRFTFRYLKTTISVIYFYKPPAFFF